MDDYRRAYPWLSLCGLHCGLCPRHHTEGASRCPGCGGEDFLSKHPACGVISCSLRRGGLEFCFQCGAYPCSKYDGAARFDSFITHRNMFADFEKARRVGLEAYAAELERKMDILKALLGAYNDGRRKSLYCLAVNLLPLEDLDEVMAQLEATAQAGQTAKEKAALAAALLRARAEQRGLTLTLNRKRKAGGA